MTTISNLMHQLYEPLYLLASLIVLWKIVRGSRRVAMQEYCQQNGGEHAK